MSASPTLLWFRQDLRLQDNPALNAAIERGGAVLPLYILDEAVEGRWPMGAASRWWLHHALASLDSSLRERGSRLIFARGDSHTILRQLCRTEGAGAVYWNRRYEPAAIGRDKLLKAELSAAGLDVRSFNSALLHEPHTLANKQGGPFQVFTPYWRTCLALPVAAPLKLKPQKISAPAAWPHALAVEELELLPRIDWAAGFETAKDTQAHARSLAELARRFPSLWRKMAPRLRSTTFTKRETRLARRSRNAAVKRCLLPPMSEMLIP